MIIHPILSQDPILSNDKVTPKIACNFETHYAMFFLNTKDGVPNNQKVAQILLNSWNLNNPMGKWPNGETCPKGKWPKGESVGPH